MLQRAKWAFCFLRLVLVGFSELRSLLLPLLLENSPKKKIAPALFGIMSLTTEKPASQQQLSAYLTAELCLGELIPRKLDNCVGKNFLFQIFRWDVWICVMNEGVRVETTCLTSCCQIFLVDKAHWELMLLSCHISFFGGVLQTNGLTEKLQVDCWCASART